MLIGSAINVTYKSEIARFTIKIDCVCLSSLVLDTTINIITFPNVPTTDANVSITIHDIANPGVSRINSYCPKYLFSYTALILSLPLIFNVKLIIYGKSTFIYQQHIIALHANEDVCQVRCFISY